MSRILCIHTRTHIYLRIMINQPSAFTVLQWSKSLALSKLCRAHYSNFRYGYCDNPTYCYICQRCETEVIADRILFGEQRLHVWVNQQAAFLLFIIISKRNIANGNPVPGLNTNWVVTSYVTVKVVLCFLLPCHSIIA